MEMSCEIVKSNEISEKVLRKKSCVEDDIDRLFQAIDIGGSCHKQFENASYKSAMKRPMRVSPSRMSSIGIAEPVNLKQALRGMCISQATEMAATKKQRLKRSNSRGFSDGERLSIATVMEDIGMEGSAVKMSFVPERTEKKLETRLELMAGGPMNTYKFPSFSEGEIVEEKCCVLDEGGPISDGPARVKSQDANMKIEPFNRGFSFKKESFKTRNFTKRKNEHKTTVSNKSIQHSEGEDDGHDHLHNPVDFRKNVGVVMSNLSTSPSSFSDLRVGSILVDGRTNGAVIKAGERTAREKADISESSKSSIECSSTSCSDESYLSASNRSGRRPHMSKDLRWEAINAVQKKHKTLGLKHFKLLKKLGGGDTANVYLSELLGTSCFFAVKVMDYEFLACRKKLLRAQSEKEILEILDHPFLPTLYAHFTTKKFSCLIIDHCPGGDLHVLRQKQPLKIFSEPSARFYVAEVLLALEYLHMLGIVYRDLKPENILIREDGHIMLSDFDLSLRCQVSPMLLKSPHQVTMAQKKISSPCADSSYINPFCLSPSWPLSCLTPKFLSTATKTRKLKSEQASQIIPLPQVIVEPTSARSNSFVGTHEYLAPEIVKEQGHGSAVDWWTFGILLFELLYGKTPFKGSTIEDTISNVSFQSLEFPAYPIISSHARDLISLLLKKVPEQRLGSTKGAAEIKQHPFFDGLNWALIRCTKPPEIPKFDSESIFPNVCQIKTPERKAVITDRENEVEFDMF